MRELRLDDSRNVRRLTWREDNTLEIEFTSGAIYKYANVQKHQFESAAGSDSVGAFVQRTFVRNPTAYPFEKLKSSDQAKAEAEQANLDASLKASTVTPTNEGMKAALEVIATYGESIERTNGKEIALFFQAVARKALGK